ncbi:2,3,4,5-tetrahydropyridine-2,6-dicarboxylate N-succinyltransferase [Halieaceae bacterium IMCC14734]|uniref:2,3,4,5-tetrahydropyridine-2,6-dicarboxylate N-succinyltransferase n=1 Tax=Candidatus Litorirhabdus singularis TaxID=2518993 RepID=A0ABT3TIL2_9GAMM|nr:2,3,4,5-tetrahydropyridine-2,6-dicarboxylate N-succinyltransferase [Candidatus Litorirhabdus singularis]MCX2982158.1 2,3,4,5-tetrahydropyridine-2,6-dicarboxylate N-succinyltransferase [Candidatus Litorirhabdus singularis]
MSQALYALGIGVGTQNSNGEWLEVFYPQPLLKPDTDLQPLLSLLGYTDGNQAISLTRDQMPGLANALRDAGQPALATAVDAMSNSARPLVASVLATDAAPASVPEAYLKLQMLSHRLVQPHDTDLTGAFAVLRNVAWTSEGAIDLEELPARQLQARLENRELEVSCVDKFPKMSNYVVPGGVRIAHTARVRLGAYLGEGTTIMHEGFVNFNAGTEGPAMIEGRISAGVMIGAGSDLGGGASTMGTLSGGGNIVNTMGSGCLVGANAGVGIPLGDRCTVEAGLYITAGTIVTMLDTDGNVAERVKARVLAGQQDLLFRRNSVSGTVECLTNRTAVELNAELHAHN